MTCRLRRRLKKEIRIRRAQRRREISEGLLLLIRNVRPSIETKITVVQRGLDCVSMHGKMLFFKSLFPARLHPKGAIEDRSFSLAKRKLESGPACPVPRFVEMNAPELVARTGPLAGRLMDSRDRVGLFAPFPFWQRWFCWKKGRRKRKERGKAVSHFSPPPVFCN